MATIVLSAVGAGIGSALGGSVLGLSSVVIGRAVGATIGQVIDQQILGVGAEPVETGKVERFRLMGASEGAPVNRVYGRTRIAGQVIWASRFYESTNTSGGGKTSGPEVTTYSYSVSLAIALCGGEILRVGRVWADGVEVSRDQVNLRVYTGTEDQEPDPLIEAIEGAQNAPAYRGIAYVVLEDLELAQFGNRVPQLSFEVVRPVTSDDPAQKPLSEVIEGVALIPGTGEFALGVTSTYYGSGPGENNSANMNTPSGKTDFETALEVLHEELPKADHTLLISSWFGTDLRAGECEIKPRVEQHEAYAGPVPWMVSTEERYAADRVPVDEEGRLLYGGTPSDQSVIEAIVALKAAGKQITFYPFILMAQTADNTLINPYTGEVGQPALPWRGRITTSLAPSMAGTTDQTAAARTEVEAFFGAADGADFYAAYDFTPPTNQAEAEALLSELRGQYGYLWYDGPSDDWGYRRFVLHYAHLCKAAGGVDAFCIGSEMRGITTIRDDTGAFPAVEAMIQLAADVRAILGPDVDITYAADWSEYFGYHPQDGSGDVLFHLDPLWADQNIDFIGIDNYMPLSDWRAGNDHADAAFEDIYDLSYLQSNIEGGEGYDWYYASDLESEAQLRRPITDGAHGEDWVFRYKDIRNWWRNEHYNRLNGVRDAVPTGWVPQSKPVVFTEYGCAAIDKGTNQPNKFLDPKSSESSLPAYSNGRRDDLIQAQYLRAMTDYWGDAANNPLSEVYGGAMIDMSRSNVWAWDTRPYPYFPGNAELWGDADNYARGHWLNGRVTGQALGAVVAEICRRAGVEDVDTSSLYGIVRGYHVDDLSSGRAALQPLMLAYGFDAVERDGQLVFRNRGDGADVVLSSDRMVRRDNDDTALELLRAPEAEVAGRVRLTFTEADADYELRSTEAIFPDEESRAVAVTQLPLILTQAEGRKITERWLAEARLSRDTARFALPMSHLDVGAGDVVQLGASAYRVDRVEQGLSRGIEAVKIHPSVYEPSDAAEETVTLTPFVAPVPVFPLFMDLPLLTGDEVPHAPHIAVTATPWPGTVAVFSAPQDNGYVLNTTLVEGAVVGVTETDLGRAAPGLWDRGPALRVRVYGGSLASGTRDAILNGANAAVIGDGSSGNWEVFQFQEAQLVAPNTYELRLRLRGQAGSDGIMPDVWPSGSYIVLLNAAAQQIALDASERNLARYYRIGPAGRAVDDASYVEKVEAFAGNGLRPYAPVHLRATVQGDGARVFSWTRRTRIDGDTWEGFEVPLGEASELYSVRIRDENGAIVRQDMATSPTWTYGAADQASDTFGQGAQFEVAQISDRFGPGPYSAVEIAI